MAQISLNSTGVASSGALSLQSNGTTEAIGISTGQVATLAQNPILTSGTANGVAYLNGSKVLTTGSALAFTGSQLNVSYADAAYNAGLTVTNTTNNAASQAKIYVVNNAGDYLSLGRNSAALGSQSAIFSTGAYPLNFYTNSNLAMTLDASGRLGIGSNSTPASYQNINGYFQNGRSGWAYVVDDSANTHLVHNIIFNGTNNTYAGTGYASRMSIIDTDGSFRWYQAGSGSSGATASLSERARIDSSGNLLVGTTSTSVASGGLTFQFAAGESYFNIGHKTGTGSGAYFGAFSYNGSIIGGITQSGTTAVLYNVTSDQRLKENIVDAPEFGSVIDSIQVRSYDWITDQTHQRAGFIAQELVTVAPEAVHQPTNPDDMMAVDYSKLVPMLVKEIQSLRQRLAAAGI